MQTLGTKLATLVNRLGEVLDFEPAVEVQATESAWVDVVWFDKRLGPTAMGFPRPNLRRAPVLPLVGFEIELSTANNPKHVKGSVSNLNNLGANVGVIVIGNASVAGLRAKTKGLADKPDLFVEKLLVERVYRWVYAESQPASRVVIMTENQVVAWAKRLGVAIPSDKAEMSLAIAGGLQPSGIE